MLSSLVTFLRWPNLYRRQFEHANLEAMDESAEWRMKYDTEFGRNRQLEDELLKVCFNFSMHFLCPIDLRLHAHGGIFVCRLRPH
jgi:hypothetical protein